MHRNYFQPLLVATAVAAMACAAPACAQDSGQVEVSLPAQDLSASLRAISRQTGRSIIVAGDLVEGRQAPAVSGQLSVEEAVRRLLAGSDLAFRHVGETIVIVSAGGGESHDAAQVAAATPEAGDEIIVVTGTHLRGAPASSPMIVIDRDDIERSGASSVEQLMRKLPQNSQGGVNQENFGALLPDQDVTDHGAGVNLRGLGQRATLVLLDGRRLAPSGFGAFVDISLIPISLVERVEILTDGASAIYGSDAVGGVVNFILRDRIEGFETTVHAGAPARGGGEQLLASQSAGADWTGGHALLAYEFRSEDEIRAADRSFTIGLPANTWILPRERRHSFLMSATQHLTSSLQIEAIGTYSHRSTDRTFFGAVSPLPIGAHAAADALTLGVEASYAFAAGWRARIEGAYALSETDQQQTQPGGVTLVNSRGVRNEVRGAALKVDGPLFDLPGGPVRAALGAEIRGEAYRDVFESSAVARNVERARRQMRSVFGELSVPLVSPRNRLPGIERLELSAAGRFDDYGQTGSTYDPKLGLLWSPRNGFDLRVSYGTSFRAPLLSEIGGIYDVFFAPAFLIYKNRTEAAPGSIAALLQGSNPDIRPETSRTWSVGAEYSPPFTPGLSLSLNYYSVRFSDRIASPINSVAVVGDPAFEPLIDRNPDPVELARIVDAAQRIFDVTGPAFSNGGATAADVDIVLDTRVNNTALTATSGLDFTLLFAFGLGANQFVLDANVNHVFSFTNRLTSASPESQALDRVYGPLAWRGRGGLGWNRGPWAGSLFVNHAGAYEDHRAPTVVPVDAYTTVDLSLSHSFGEQSPSWLRGTRLSLFAENLFDADPPAVLLDPGRTVGLGYDPVNASGRGRFVSVRLRRTW